MIDMREWYVDAAGQKRVEEILYERFGSDAQVTRRYQGKLRLFYMCDKQTIDDFENFCMVWKIPIAIYVRTCNGVQLWRSAPLNVSVETIGDMWNEGRNAKIAPRARAL